MIINLYEYFHFELSVSGPNVESQAPSNQDPCIGRDISSLERVKEKKREKEREIEIERRERDGERKEERERKKKRQL